MGWPPPPLPLTAHDPAGVYLRVDMDQRFKVLQSMWACPPGVAGCLMVSCRAGGVLGVYMGRFGFGFGGENGLLLVHCRCSCSCTNPPKPKPKTPHQPPQKLCARNIPQSPPSLIWPWQFCGVCDTPFTNDSKYCRKCGQAWGVSEGIVGVEGLRARACSWNARW